MLEIFFEAPFALNRLRSGPSRPYIDGFARRLKDEGYSWWTARRYLRSATHFGRFVEFKGSGLGCVDDATVSAFGEHLPRCECPQANGGSTEDTVRGAKAFIGYLRSIGVIKPVYDEAPREAQVVASFRQWLQQHRGAAESTRYHYCRAAAKLIESLGNDPNAYDAQRLRSFILETARRSGPGATKTLITGARAFLRYLIAEGRCRAGLDGAIPAVAGWRLASLKNAPGTRVFVFPPYAQRIARPGIRLTQPEPPRNQ